MLGSGELKRFYKQAAAAAAEGGFEVRLDGRAVRTPGRALLLLPTRPLAEAVAAEWAAQEARVRRQDMALMSLSCTALDLVRPRRAAVIAELADYGGTDLICYQAERPDALVARQHEIWRPLLDWGREALSAPLRATPEVLAVPQPEAALTALERAVAAHDDWALTALANAVKGSGSLVIGLALSHGRLDPAGAFEAAELHDTHQIEVWGEDADATKRRATVRRDLETAARFLTLLRE